MCKSLVVVGLGKSGSAAALLAVSQGYKTYIYDQNDELLQAFIQKHPAMHSANNLALGQVDFAILSPGVPIDDAWVQKNLMQKKIVVKSEVLFSLEHALIPAIAVTGTNGKSTVVHLSSLLLEQAGIKAVPCGNFGLPLAEVAMREIKPEMLVVELSSFQLEPTTSQDHPFFEEGIVLNIAEDHLDRHRTMEKYLLAKLNLRHLVHEKSAVLVESKVKLEYPFVFEGMNYRTYSSCDALDWEREGYEFVGLFSKGVLKENLISALHLTKNYGVKPEHALHVQKTFAPLPFRLEVLLNSLDLTIINDSKATNPHSTAAALQMVSTPFIWIAGGAKDKGSDFSVLKPWVENRDVKIVAIGEEQDRIEKVFSPVCPVIKKNCFDEAVFYAFSLAKRGDCVLLSPACASFDMFENYQDRGRQFTKLVRKWEDRKLNE